MKTQLTLAGSVLFLISAMPLYGQRSYGAGSEGTSGGARGSGASQSGSSGRSYSAGKVTGATGGVGRPVVGRLETNIDNRNEPAEPPMRDSGPQRYEFQRPYGNNPDEIGFGGSYDPSHDRPWRPWDYYRFYYPYVELEYYEGPVDETRPSTAQYSVVKPAPQVWVEGHYEKVPMEDVIEGQTIEVYHPAIYEMEPNGKLRLVEKEKTTREPKTRVIMARVWIEGHYETAPPDMRHTGHESQSEPLAESRAEELRSPQSN